MDQDSGWVPIGEAFRIGKNYFVNAECGCGRKDQIRVDSGKLRSKACFACTRRKPRHGYSHTKTYRVWQSIRDRCFNSNAKAYPNYGGRGIQVCDRWGVFENFLADMGEMPPKMSIGRIDNDGDYEPKNCRWETRKQQNNNSRQNVFLTYMGITQTTAQWAELIGAKPHALRNRLRLGMSIKDALTLPFDTMSVKRTKMDYIRIEYKGETLTCSEWEERTGIDRTTILWRWKAGWTSKQILTTPVRQTNP